MQFFFILDYLSICVYHVVSWWSASLNLFFEVLGWWGGKLQSTNWTPAVDKLVKLLHNETIVYIWWLRDTTDWCPVWDVLVHYRVLCDDVKAEVHPWIIYSLFLTTYRIDGVFVCVYVVCLVVCWSLSKLGHEVRL